MTHFKKIKKMPMASHGIPWPNALPATPLASRVPPWPPWLPAPRSAPRGRRCCPWSQQRPVTAFPMVFCWIFSRSLSIKMHQIYWSWYHSNNSNCFLLFYLISLICGTFIKGSICMKQSPAIPLGWLNTEFRMSFDLLGFDQVLYEKSSLSSSKELVP